MDLVLGRGMSLPGGSEELLPIGDSLSQPCAGLAVRRRRKLGISGLRDLGIGNQGWAVRGHLREADEQANRSHPSVSTTLHITYSQALVSVELIFFKPITHETSPARLRWGQTEFWAGVRLKFYMGFFGINWAALVSAAPNTYTGDSPLGVRTLCNFRRLVRTAYD